MNKNVNILVILKIYFRQGIDALIKYLDRYENYTFDKHSKTVKELVEKGKIEDAENLLKKIREECLKNYSTK